MRVNHKEDYVTHATIGGNQAIDASIADDAEFYHILSSTLYTDQKLAVVRETLCNAWDAHIEAGITDRPIEITLDRSSLIIRDYGTGIPMSSMGAVYLTYGGSSKRNTKNVTGGFGLGCKAPWAYKDHFEVTSWCNGTMTIYNLSKSNAEVNGKPSAIPIVSLPTTETGLQVKIDIDHNDYQTFLSLINRIVINGGMNAKVNDNVLPVLPFKKMENGFMLTEHKFGYDNLNQGLFIRLGHVVYPIPEHDEYKHDYKQIVEYLNKLSGMGGYYNNYNSKWRILFQAEPGSISITPSREAISLQNHTIKTLKEIFSKFLTQKNKIEDIEFNRIADESTNRIWLDGKPADLITPLMKIININNKFENSKFIFDFPKATRQYLQSNYPKEANFHYKNMLRRLDALIEGKFGNQSLIRSFRKAYVKRNKTGQNNSSWFHKKITVPLMRKMEAYPDLSISKLHLYGLAKKGQYGEEVKFTPLMEVKTKWRELDHYMPLLRNFVILSFNRMDVNERAPDFPIFEHWFKDTSESLVYIVPRNSERVKSAKKFFEEQGMYIVDLTERQKWEHVQATLPRMEYAAIPKKPKKLGIPLMSEAIVKDSNNRTIIKTLVYRSEDVKRIENPEFVLKLGDKLDQNQILNLGYDRTLDLLNMFGSKGGIVVNENQLDKYIDAGAKHLEDYILEKILDQFENNQRIKESLPFLFSRLSGHVDYYEWRDTAHAFQVIYANKDLREYYGIVNTLTDEDLKYIKINEAFSRDYLRGKTDKLLGSKIQEIINKTPVDPLIKTLVSKFRVCPLIKMFDGEEMASFLNSKKNSKLKQDQIRVELIRDTFLKLIEG